MEVGDCGRALLTTSYGGQHRLLQVPSCSNSECGNFETSLVNAASLLPHSAGPSELRGEPRSKGWGNEPHL